MIFDIARYEKYFVLENAFYLNFLNVFLFYGMINYQKYTNNNLLSLFDTALRNFGIKEAFRLKKNTIA